MPPYKEPENNWDKSLFYYLHILQNAPIYLWNRGPSVKLPQISWFFIVIFNFGYRCIIICELNKSIHETLTNSCTILDMDDCRCVILKEINNFVSLIASLIFKFKSIFSKKKLPLIENLRIKSLNCFKHQINIIVVILSCGSFFH